MNNYTNLFDRFDQGKKKSVADRKDMWREEN